MSQNQSKRNSLKEKAHLDLKLLYFTLLVDITFWVCLHYTFRGDHILWTIQSLSLKVVILFSGSDYTTTA